MNNYKFIENKCFLCEETIPYEVLYSQNFNSSTKIEEFFSPKSGIDNFYHHRIVKCKKCSLVYSNPILEKKTIENLYKKSKFCYYSEIENINQTYQQYFILVKELVPSRERFLEIGCGNGSFLEIAIRENFKEVFGVEPCEDAVTNAPDAVKNKIKNDFFRPSDFKDNFFDLICFFQVLDHALEPNEFLSGVYRGLKKGGIALCIVHNINSFSSRILRERCPIVDMSHILLFDKSTLKKFFLKHGFKILDVIDITNIYSIKYWIQMFALPKFINNILIFLLSLFDIENKKLKIKAGNVVLIAKKE